MKKVLKGSAIAFGIILFLTIAFYFLIGFYYMDGFPCFTWINGVYCTGKSVAEVNSELVGQDEYSGIAVLGRDDEKLFVSASDVDMKTDYTEAVRSVYQTRNPFLWGVYLFEDRNYRYDPVVTLSRDKLKDKISEWYVALDPEDVECRIVKTDDSGYVLENAFITVPDTDRITDLVFDRMISRESVADISLNDGCYRDIDLRGRYKDETELAGRLDRIQDITVAYKIGDDEIVFDAGSISDTLLTADDYELALEEKVSNKVLGAGRFIIGGAESQLPAKDSIRIINNIVTDAEGNPIISEKKLYAFFEDIVEKYDTRNLMDMYQKGAADTIIINKNSRGNGSIIDVSKEFDYLKNMIIEGGESLRDSREITIADNIITVDASEELGKTYIEIDMGDQQLYYYVDGDLDMSFPVVTGNVNRGRGTPVGVYKVYNKRYHTYLRGADYVSYVNYWLGVHKGVGIHDATWRDKFGGEIYRSGGSHGCINCPLDQAAELWEKVEVDTPVILYY